MDVSVLGDAPVGEAREVAILNDANPPVRSPELPDRTHRDFHAVVNDVVLADRVSSVDGCVSMPAEACPGAMDVSSGLPCSPGRPWYPQIDCAMFTSLFASRAMRCWSSYPNSRDAHVDASRSRT